MDQISFSMLALYLFGVVVANEVIRRRPKEKELPKLDFDLPDITHTLKSALTYGPKTLEDFQNLAAQEMYLDGSRQNFLRRHYENLENLMNGELKGRNRFRELLLGTKACGKTTIMRFIEKYAATRYQNLVVVFIKVEAREPGSAIMEILKIIKKKYPAHYEDCATCLQEEKVYERTNALETALLKSGLRVLLLIDEFQFVYIAVDGKGTTMVEEIANLSDTKLGAIHIIVSGSSSTLRKLAFCKMKGLNKSEYPSFTGTDLNSTKLQPSWIYPLRIKEDVDRFFVQFPPKCLANDENPHRNIEQFILSGGRPGLLREDQLRNTIFSVKLGSKKNLTTEKVLSSIYQCVESFTNADSWDGANSMSGEYDSIYDALTQVPFATVLHTYRERFGEMEEADFEMICFDLADAGYIIYTERDLGFSCLTVYFTVKSSTASTLTWKEAAALKFPHGLFENLAEEVALRILRENHEKIHGLGLGNLIAKTPSTLLFGNAKKTPPAISGLVDFSTADHGHIFGYLHKELYDNKDNAGSDAIFLSLIKGSKKCNVVRIQIKLKKGEIGVAGVNGLKIDMATRGKKVIDCINERYTVAKWSNILFTTQLLSDAEDSDLAAEDNGVHFCVFSRKSLATFWPEDVQMLGEPYAGNRQMKKLVKNLVADANGTDGFKSPSTLSLASVSPLPPSYDK